MNLLNKNQVAVRIAVIISLAEFFVMLMLDAIPHKPGTLAEALLDAASLSAISIPAIYYWVIKPFVSARDDALAQLNRLADTDPLTQLANRRRISKQLGMIIADSIRYKDHGAVLLIDVDGFKLVNDKHGHEVGDAVLVEIAKRMQSLVRSEEVVGRLGGDEFVLLLHRLSVDERIAHDKALLVAEKMIDAISKPYYLNGEEMHVGASIGVRLLGFDGLDTETAISQADTAMYRAKEAGKGCVAFFGN
ncbi:MAG TPA: GGDEF domain-containing protein [Gallionella sp.]|nr:GGDEF domain-containing protein [Gallionella sp.]